MVQNSTILLVDDDVALLASLSTQLEEAGYRVLKASEIRQAELLAVEHAPDMVILEVDSEGGAGWNLLDRLVSLQPVIVLSGLGLEDQVVRGLDAGAADYLTKPYRSAELLARVRARLEGARRVAELAHSHNGINALAPSELREAVVVPDQAPATGPTEPPRSPGPATDWVKLAAAVPAVPQQTLVAQQRERGEEEEPVFIDSVSEARLLAAASAAVGEGNPSVDEDLAGLSLGRKLNTARRRRHISLVQVENDTRIRMWYLQAMEDEKFALLPRGELSEQLVRTYTQYLGLDTANAVEEFRRLHYNPSAPPLVALGGAPQARQFPRWPFMLLAVVLALVVSISAIMLIDPGGARALVDGAYAWVYSLLN